MLEVPRRLIKLPKRFDTFKVLGSTRSIQCAAMVLQPKQSTGRPQNEHPRSEQWLFVITGQGEARVNKRCVDLNEGSLLLIDKGELHQITNTGATAADSEVFRSAGVHT
jgi:mannose-6-phosphate isomerase-like protein (cupin superfamily)